MEQWQDQSIILSLRPHGESGAVVSVLTENYGRRSGYVHGALSSKHRGTLQIGNIADTNWRARTADNLGTLTLELSKSVAARMMHDPLKLLALQSACALCDQSIPENEKVAGAFYGLHALFDILDSEVWESGYILWEIALLRELGFSLDFSKCAGGGDNNALAYISPKTGRAVSYQAGEPYKDKLLPLPSFLKPNGGPAENEDILTGLQLTKFFLQHWAFAHHSRGLPEARERLSLRFIDVFAKRRTQKNDNNDKRDTDALGTDLYVEG